MIAWVRGRLREREGGRVVVDVGGVGYLLHVPATTLVELPAAGETVELVVHTLVREDAITLYGFRRDVERQVFEQVLRVTGVGPRIALALLSALAPEGLLAAVREGDALALAAVPGIGRKTAERLLVELRDRLPAVVALAAPAPADRAGGLQVDVVSALVNLGYPERQASRAAAAALAAAAGAPSPSPALSLDEALRRALQRLSPA